jgi:hypothetical protein
MARVIDGASKGCVGTVMTTQVTSSTGWNRGIWLMRRGEHGEDDYARPLSSRG